MNSSNTQEFHVSINVDCYQYDVSVGLPKCQYLGYFEINNNKTGFAYFFEKIEPYKIQSNGVISVAMEGYNGHARSLDRIIQSKYHLLTINNFEMNDYWQAVDHG